MGLASFWGEGLSTCWVEVAAFLGVLGRPEDFLTIPASLVAAVAAAWRLGRGDEKISPKGGETGAIETEGVSSWESGETGKLGVLRYVESEFSVKIIVSGAVIAKLMAEGFSPGGASRTLVISIEVNR